jgi:integrase
MPVYKRKGTRSLYVEVDIGGKRTRRSAETTDLREAEEFEQHLRTGQWREIKLGDRGQTPFKKAAERWLKRANVPGKKNNNAGRMAWFTDQRAIADCPICDIDKDDAINEMRESLEEGYPGKEVVGLDGTKTVMYTERSLDTVDRYMTDLRSVLNMCEELKWIDKAPKVPMHNTAQTEAVWLTREAFDGLLAQLPPHLALCALFAVLTGVRMRAMLQLTWDKVDLKNRRAWIAGRVQKNGQPLGLPLSREVRTLLVRCRTLNPTGNHVFQYQGQPIDDCNTAAFKKACERAKLHGIKWHTFRHTFAAWAVQNGVRLERLMELGGWRSIKSVLRYSHLASEHLLEDAERVAGAEPFSNESNYRLRKRGEGSE